MSHFDNYSSEEGSTGEIEFPKTPGQPQREENDGEHDHHRVDNDSEEDEEDDGSSSSSAVSEAESNADSNIGDNDDHHNKSSDRDNDSEDNDDHASDREVEPEAAEGSDKEQNNEEEEEEMSLDVNAGEATNNAKDDAAEVEGNASQSNSANQNNVDDSDSEDDDEAMRRLMMHRPQEMDMEMNMADQEEEEEERPEVTRIEAEAPRMKINFKQADFKSVDYVKLPNFLSIDTHPFDPKTYEDEACDDDRQDDEGRARLKLKVENTIRWRRILDEEDGNEVDRESNARIVKWSDGTCSLYLGDEIFHMTKHSQTGDNNHLFIRDQAGWSAQTIFKNKLTFRPSSTDSVTHRKLTLSLADRSQKTQKICVLPSVGIDPDAHRSEMIKKEEDRLKASIRKENQTRRLKERVYTRTGINSSFLEDNDEDDEGSFSISKIKNQYKSGGGGGGGNSQSAVYSSSDSDSSDDDFKGKRHR